MSRRGLRRVTPGDVFELAIDGGFVGLQAIGEHITHGWAVRVTAPEWSQPVGDARLVENAPELYIVLIGDLAFEETENRVRYVGHAELPYRYREHFPRFRASASYDADGRHERGSWWLDDGQQEWRVGELSEAEKHYPYRQITPALALKDLIQRGWDPEWEFKGPDAQQFTKPGPRSEHRPSASFYMTFPTENCAQNAQAELASKNLFKSITAEQINTPNEYLVVAHAPKPVNLRTLEVLLDRIAREYGGEYDGNELPIR